MTANKLQTSSLAAAMLLTSLALTPACAPTGADDLAPTGESETTTSTEPLYPDASLIWRTLNIPVCWEQSGWSTEKGWVRSQIEATWAAPASSDVRFSGWGTCTSSSRGIRIDISDEQPHTDYLGRDLDGASGGMVLNFSFLLWNTSACFEYVDTGRRERCIRWVAAHEFGHALGFSHEQNRSDTPSSCTDAPQGSDGTTFVGAWDLDSIMNYCNPDWNNRGQLSAGDLLGLRLFYGGSMYKGTRRDALDIGTKRYFFNGAMYTRFDTDNMYVDSYYPKYIASFWGNWPSTWTDGVDAAINWGNGKAYFFRGAQYVRYDIALDRVDPGYPTSLTPNWHNWPSTWTSVDAAVDWGNGKAYFFRGSEYIRVNKANFTVDAGYPRPISGNWPGIWTSGVDFVTRLDNGKVYFFKGSQYIRFDPDNMSADPGYPNVIAGNWPGVPF